MLKKSREVWEIEKIEEVKNINLFEYVNIWELDDISLKEVFLQKGLKMDDIEDAISITIFITKNLFNKSGVTLKNDDIINIIIDSLQKIKLII